MAFEGFFYEEQEGAGSASSGTKSETQQREEALKEQLKDWGLNDDDAGHVASAQVNNEEAKKQGRDPSDIG